ncbi:MAG: hypothetical protein AAGC65_05765 [Mucilaginibacter sp.]|uniref:hypothetical protein n=1 Tax=Mucilaginibacter sp. TaxID=1882438 RepID=UPI0031AC20F9
MPRLTEAPPPLLTSHFSNDVGTERQPYKKNNYDPTIWNSHAGRAIGHKTEIRALNNYLNSLQTKLRNAHQELIDANQQVTTEKPIPSISNLSSLA